MFEHIKLSKAANVTDWNGVIYSRAVLEEVKVGFEVRVHMYVSDDTDLDGWDYESDSPYVIIREQNGPEFLGEITRRYRFEEDLKYPVRAGERIWFRKEHIIEIPSKFQSEEAQAALRSYIPDHDDYVPITGPLYLVQHPNSDDESYDSDEPYSSSDNETPAPSPREVLETQVLRRGRKSRD